MKNYILLISCEDKSGITARVTDFIFKSGGNIVHSDQHIDDQTNTFFMRVAWGYEFDAPAIDDLKQKFASIGDQYNMSWKLHDSSYKPKVALFVSKHLHCLYDLLWRYRSGQFHCEIPFIISNHEDASHAAESFGIPFYYVPVEKSSKGQAEQQQLELLEQNDIDLVVLARYMQILSPEFVAKYSNQIINIHHSFLPAFKGANPYARAHSKGVKLIGATSHYVNEELDMGPIIDQDTVRVSHRDTVDDMIRKGMDLEKVVLSRAISWHLDYKILSFSNKTVIFD